jgi:hypothetical protein
MSLFCLVLLLVPQNVPGIPVRPGMTSDEVRAILGPTGHIARQIVHRRYVEQWHYPKTPIWINFDGSKGQELRVRNLNPLDPSPRR